MGLIRISLNRGSTNNLRIAYLTSGYCLALDEKEIYCLYIKFLPRNLSSLRAYLINYMKELQITKTFD